MLNNEAVKALRKSFPSKKDVLENTPDSGVVDMINHLNDMGCDTCFDRFDAQKPHCVYGLTGICCKACHMGPCQIMPKATKGTCGADEHVISSRNMLRWMAGGVSSHGARSREVILNMIHIAKKGDDEAILGQKKLVGVAKAFNIFSEEKSVCQLAIEVGNLLLEDLSRSSDAPHKTIAAFAPKDRIALWKKLDIMPISTYHEVFEAMHRTGVGTDGDWQNLMQQMLRCGLSFSFGSVLGGALAMDILYGPPKRSIVDTNFDALKPEFVNIAVHGHTPVIVHTLVELAHSKKWQDKAKAKGAAGIRLYGICCSGLSAAYRQGEVHPLSNAIGAELVMGTGALDAWVVDVQDVYPSIMDVAQCFHTKIITTNDSAKLPGAIHLGLNHTDSNFDEIASIAERILDIAIDNRPLRVAGNVYIPRVSAKAELGFSVESLFEAFGGANHLLKSIKEGEIKGIVNLVGCNNPKVMYEKTICDVADILLSENILVLTNGCASFPLLKLGYCQSDANERSGESLRAKAKEVGIPSVLHFGECLDNARASALFKALSDLANEPTAKMPFAFSSPEWSNEKGVGAALGFRLMGFNSYHCIEPPISGSELVTKYFYEDTKDILGAVMVVDINPQSLALKIVDDFNIRRKNLGWE
jgi:carbon-monoxide dehydrogenase catalytic subunit